MTVAKNDTVWDRMPCIIPHCNCSVSRDKHPNSSEVICAKHWKLVPKKLKLLKRRAHARIMKDYNEKNARALDRIWEKCKAKAMPV